LAAKATHGCGTLGWCELLKLCQEHIVIITDMQESKL
jgi:hypothetical protein